MKFMWPVILLFSSWGFAQECSHEKAFADQLASNLKDPVLQNLAKEASGEFNPHMILSAPAEVTSNSVKYTFEPETVLQPRQCVYMAVPTELRDKSVQTVILGHRANPEMNRGVNEETKYDSLPALTSVQVNMNHEDGKPSWRYWGGSSSGKFGAKFAEPRWELERENLYEWYKNGHSDVESGIQSFEPFGINAMRVCSVGDDPLNLGFLELRVFPGYAKSYIEQNFGHGTKMGDSLTAKGRSYGELAGAITLNGENKGKIPDGWKLDYDSLRIPLESGRTFKTFEISVSDTHASTLGDHDDNQHTTAGWAELDVGIRKKDGSYVPIIRSENVPPRGVINGAPATDVKIQPGDELVVRGSSDQLHVLGLKIGID